MGKRARSICRQHMGRLYEVRVTLHKREQAIIITIALHTSIYQIFKNKMFKLFLFQRKEKYKFKIKVSKRVTLKYYFQIKTILNSIQLNFTNNIKMLFT